MLRTLFDDMSNCKLINKEINNKRTAQSGIIWVMNKMEELLLKYLLYFVILQVRCKIPTLEFGFIMKSAVCLVAAAMKNSEILRGGKTFGMQ